MLVLSLMGGCLYSYLETQNEITHLKMQIPERERELKGIREENHRLSYQIEQFQSPSHLMELAHRPEFAHLKHPFLQEVLTVPEALASN